MKQPQPSRVWLDLVGAADLPEFAPHLPKVEPALRAFEGEPPSIVTAGEFAATKEPGAEALIGDENDKMMAGNSNVMLYGDGGAGKTTLGLDLSCHLAAGDDWLKMNIPRAVRVLVIENEGPRPLFREKIDRKLNGWTGSPIEDRLLIWEKPWAAFTFAEQHERDTLAAVIREHQVDVVIIGPVTASGMQEAGTLQDVRAFTALLDEVRTLCGRRVTFILVHHENKGGKVSGAWEGCGDTLLHVQGQGHGRTRVYVQKARWASTQHATTLHLVWTGGDGFALDETDEFDDETLAVLILSAIGENPGTGWGKVEQATKGVNASRRRAIRDRLMTSGEIVNKAKVDGAEVLLNRCEEAKAAHLYLADDPTISHLRPSRDAVGTQSASAGGVGGPLLLRPASAPIGTQDVDAAGSHPADDDFGRDEPDNDGLTQEQKEAFLKAVHEQGLSDG